MKIKSLFLTAAVLLTALSACNKEDGQGGAPDEGTSNLYLRFSQGAESRADAAPVNGNTAVTFNSGYIIFTDGLGDILTSAEVTATSQGGTTYTVSQLEQGVVFNNIPNSASRVYVIGNHTIATMPGNISAVVSETTNLAAEADVNYGVTNATLFGDGVIEPTSASATHGADREALVKVSPLIARMELNKITAGGTIDADFTIAGIYINNFYYEMNITGGSPVASSFHNNGTDHTQYVAGNAGGYPAAWNQLLFDQPGLITGLEAKPTNGTWAYNVFVAPLETPHIVLHLTGLSAGGTAIPNSETGNDGEAFLTVYKYTSGSSNVTLESGHIYRIANLAFDEDDLEELPEESLPDPDDEYTVYVEIEMLPWIVVDVEGGLRP